MWISVSFKKRSCLIINRQVGGHQELLKGNLGRRGTFGRKGELEVVDDPVHHSIVGEEGDDLHRAPASGGSAEGQSHRPCGSSRASPWRGCGGAPPRLSTEGSFEARLQDFAPVGVGAQAVDANNQS
jgi:hypothetical protein